MEALIDSIYEAGLRPDHWSSLLQDVSGRFKARGALLLVSQLGGQAWVGSPSMISTMSEFVSAGWAQNNDREQRLLAVDRAGFVSDADLFSSEEMSILPVYKEFLGPRGFSFGAGTSIVGANGDRLLLTVEGFESDNAAQAALDGLDGLRPHFARAAMLASRMGLERAHAGVQALDMIGIPAVVVNRGGRIAAANGSMQAILGRGLEASWSRLRLPDPAADRLLADTLRGIEAGLTSGRSFPLRLTNDPAPSVIHVLPVKGSARDIFTGASSIVVVTAMRGNAGPGPALLATLFDLTVAEARLTNLVISGSSIQECAVMLGVSPHTTRNQIKSVFAKTGISRQVDLVTLLGSLSLPQRSH